MEKWNSIGTIFTESCKGCGANDWRNGRCDYCGGNVMVKKETAFKSNDSYDFKLFMSHGIVIHNPLAVCKILPG